MTDETTVDATEANDQAAQDAFAAGFAEVRGDAQVEAEKPVAEAAEKPVDEVDAESLKAVADEEPLLTKEQVTALLSKVQEYDSIRQSHDKLAGRVGSLMQELAELKKVPEKPKVELPVVNEDEFTQSYPEFASYLQAQLAKAQPTDLMERLNAAEQRSAQMAMALEETKITMLVPDWAETVNSDGYKAWLLTQPEQVQKVAMESPYAADLAKVLTTYKQTATKAATAAKNKAKLEAAVVPSGVPAQRPAEPTPEDAFLSGWNTVRGRSV